MGLARRVPLLLLVQPLVEVVGLQLADLVRRTPDEAAGHHLEHAGHAALAGRRQVGPVLVEQGGNEIIVGALVRLQRDQLAELVEGGQVGRAVRGVVRPFGEFIRLWLNLQQ